MGACVERLVANGNLVRVASPVDPVHELVGVACHFEGQEVVLCDGTIQIPAVRGHELNPATDSGLDATAPYPRPKAFERVKMARVDVSKLDIRW